MPVIDQDPVTVHPNDIANMPADVTLTNVPDFEQPTAAATKIVLGKSDDSDLPANQITVASADYGDYNNKGKDKRVVVYSPKDMDQGILNHEVFHLIQEDQTRRSYEADVPHNDYVRANDASVYDYGGLEGLEGMLRNGKTLTDLNNEQQAAVLQDYTNAMSKFGLAQDPDSVKARNSKNPVDRQVQAALDAANAKRNPPEKADRLNRAYGPFIRQMAEMARAGDTINTTPATPGPPPAALTGAIKPLPEIGGKTIQLHTRDVSNAPIKKRVYQQGATSLAQ
jgi:hypothetical protein